jgi:hypothetical protein
MSKDKISDYSATANSNTDIGGINIDEGCAPSGINDAIRTLMKQLKDFQQGTQSDVFKGPLQVGAASSIEVTDDTNAALRITQLGTGNALLVEDSSNPDSSPFVIDASGNVIIGNTTAISSYSSVIPSISQHGLTVSQATNSITHWGNSSTDTPQFLLSKSRGGAIGTRAIVSSNDTLGNFSVWGDDGTTFVEATRISAQVDGTPGTNDMPGRLVFSTTADGASTVTERVRIDSVGHVKINNPSGANGLQLDGSSYTSSPRLFFTNDTQSFAIYQGTAEELLFTYGAVVNSSSGTTGIRMTSTGGFQISKDSVTSPASTDGNVFSGTYTPTLTNGTNVTASTNASCQYMRVGNTVTVSGTVTAITTTAAGNSLVSISLPVTSNLSAIANCAGAAVFYSTTFRSTSCAIYADATNDLAVVNFTAPSGTTGQAFSFQFTYKVI